MTFPRLNFKAFLIPVFVASLFFISCQDSKETNKEATETVPEASLEQKKQLLNNAVPASNSKSNSSSTAAGTNPPHGQPGHRCDIAVGAPLDGSSAGKASPVQVNPVKAKSNTASEAPADGLNPAHGQPGHRCDVKVGDPL